MQPNTANIRRYRSVWRLFVHVLVSYRTSFSRLLLFAAIGMLVAMQLFDDRSSIFPGLTVVFLLITLVLSYSGQRPQKPPNSQSSLNLLQTFMTCFVAGSSHVDPFRVLLREVQSQLSASDAALYVTQEAGQPIVLLVSSPNSDIDGFAGLLLESWSGAGRDKRFLRHSGTHEEQNSQMLSIKLCDRAQACRGYLLLRIRDPFYSEGEVVLQSLGEDVAAILCSVQAAQASHRQALYEERGVIARELHDSLAQSLSYLKIQVARLQALLMPGKSSQPLNRDDIDTIVQELRVNLNLAYQQLRDVITTFRLSTDGRSFSQALEDSVKEFENRSGIVFRLDNRISSGKLTVEQEMHALHIIREALSNVVRHSQAKCAEISLHMGNESKVNLVVEDDGIGIGNTQKQKQRHGLVIMQQRAHNLGGDFSVSASPLGGTRIEVSFASGQVADQVAREK